MAVIAVGVITNTVSLERGTAKSYSSRYQAELAAPEWFASCVKDIGRKPQRQQACYREGHIPGRASR